MGFFDRFKTAVGSQANSVLDSYEQKNYDKILRYSNEEARVQYSKALSAHAKVEAFVEKEKADVDEVNAKIADNVAAAKGALRAGDDDTARKLLEENKLLEVKLQKEQKEFDVVKAECDQLTEILNALADRIEQSENTQSQVAASKATNEAAKILAGADSKLDLDNPNSTLSRVNDNAKMASYETKALLNKAKPKPMDELELARQKYLSDSSVDDDLEKLKAEMQSN